MDAIDPLNEIAKDNFNIDYIFPYQRLVISNILKSAGVTGFEPDPSEEEETTPHQIVLLPTGAGKSLCFMLPCFLLDGITLVIFPLLSLMSDQLRRTEEAGINAVILKGGQSREERSKIFQKCRSNAVKMILTNPETALNNDIQRELKTLTIAHLVIDETHTVSEWGESFRPAYLEIHSILDALEIGLVTAFTATASPHILQKITEIIFPGTIPNIIYGNPDRDNISYKVIPSTSPTRTLQKLTEDSKKPLIIFAASRTGTELTARMLRNYLKHNNIFFYHAGLNKEEKDKVEKWFFDSENGILVATCAYGMVYVPYVKHNNI
jgi:ATP-dependent DNA helicase RecQ